DYYCPIWHTSAYLF
nr:immunoglobulin light chain junction region [Macaca mulatta]